MKNLFKHILFGAAIFAGMGLFVGCDTMTDDEIEKLINDKLNDNATADATPPVALAGTTWVSHSDFTDGYYKEATLSFTETTLSYSSKTYKKEDDSLLDEYEWNHPINYYVQGNIIIVNIPTEGQPIYFPKDDCIIWGGMSMSKFYRVEE